MQGALNLPVQVTKKTKLIDTHKTEKACDPGAMNSILELPFNMTVNVETLLIEQKSYKLKRK